MRRTGVHNFPAIDRVIYGKAAAEAVSEEAERLKAKHVFLIVSRTLNTKTDEIEKIRRALGDKHVATFDGIAQHTTRKQAAEVARQANDARADSNRGRWWRFCHRSRQDSHHGNGTRYRR